MVKYVLAALALKAFSLNDATKKAYRSIGNVVGQRARQNTDRCLCRARGSIRRCARSMAPSRRTPMPSSWAIGNIGGLLADFHRTLKPGGYYDSSDAGSTINLQHYDPAESPKNYLRFSDQAWKLLFEDDVQYFNRLQACGWIDRIGSAGFVFLERIAETADVGGLPIALGFGHYRQEDLACTILILVHQKPY